MKCSVGLLLLVCLGASWAAPVEDGPQAASCADAVVLGAANEAMDKINKDRTEGYVYALRDVVNAHTQRHGENSIMFYLTLNIHETNCSVLSKRHFKSCEVQTGTPAYGQCKVAIFLSRVNRVVRLYKYNCAVRPVANEKIVSVCPDCPSRVPMNDDEIQKTVSKGLEKFNKESGLSKFFKLLQVTKATSSYIMSMGMMYNAEFSIQETTCANGAQNPEDCPLMDCEFAHKGFCKASHGHGPVDPSGAAEESVDVSCEIYEPEAAEQEKKLHLLGGETTHSHDHTHDHTHDHAHTHAGHSHSHPHNHGHHDAAHDHTHDHPHQHHQHQHAPGTDPHHHDHELALDHAHKHAHLHTHEHHHHHHHAHPQIPQHKPEGMWREIPALGGPVTLPAFPDVPAGDAGVTLPAREDPQIPGQMEPTVGPFPTNLSPDCPSPQGGDIVATMFVEDPEFKLPA